MFPTCVLGRDPDDLGMGRLGPPIATVSWLARAEEPLRLEHPQPGVVRNFRGLLPGDQGPCSGRWQMFAPMVYLWCMSRTNIDIDEDACRVVMERYNLSTKREAVNFALRTVAGEPLSLEKARRLRGSGWDGDLDEMRTHRTG